MTRPLVLAITGASGAIYAIRLLELLLQHGREVHLSISPSGRAVLRQELAIDVALERFDPLSLTRSGLADHDTPEIVSPTENSSSAEPAYDFATLVQRSCLRLRQAFMSVADDPARLRYHHYADFMAPIASGSFLTSGMVICPCSGSTLSGVVHGTSGNLIQRAADVHLKEHRRLILVPRETPVSSIQLRNMQAACEAGAVLLPAMPGWYHGVRSLQDLVDFIVARILDQLEIPHALMRRWGQDAICHEARD
jgi:4-hydroxy-3-polyprenylbenzoate decarboxylase